MVITNNNDLSPLQLWGMFSVYQVDQGAKRDDNYLTYVYW